MCFCRIPRVVEIPFSNDVLRYGLMVPYSNQNHRHRDRIVRIQGVAVAII